MQHERTVTLKDFISSSLGCELKQRGALSGEKSRSVEVFWSVYCKLLEQGLLFWVCIVTCTMGPWSWLRPQGITVMQIKFYGQYDSQLVVSASSLGWKAMELSERDHRTVRVRDNHRKHWGKGNITKSHCQWFWSRVSVPEEWNECGLQSLSCWVWIQPFSNKATTDVFPADRRLGGSLW